MSSCNNVSPPVAGLVINARFLKASETGVQRFSRLISQRFPEALLKEPPNKWADQLRANLWEQCSLCFDGDPRKLLWSPANIGPLVRRAQILTMHDAAVFEYPAWFGWKFALWYRFAWIILARNAYVITTVSEFSRGELAHYLGLNEREIAIIPNGGDHIKGFAPLRPAKLSLRENERFVVSVGSLQPRKDTLTLLNAWSLVEFNCEARLVIVGTSGHVFAEAELGVFPDSVEFLGRVTDRELAWLYNNAIGCVSASLYEGFDIPPLEALNSGCPIILSDIPVHREIFDGAAEFFSPGDFGKLAELLRSLCACGRPIVLNEKCLEIVRFYTWENAAMQARRVFASAIRNMAGSVL